MNKFKLTEDLYILDKVILPKNAEVSFDEDDEVKISTEYGPITFTKEMLKAKDSGKKTNYVILSPKNLKIPKINTGKTPAPNSGLA